MFDLFVAKLRCPECGAISPETSVTNMQTHLRDDANGSELGVGALLPPLDVRPDDLVRSGYHLVAQPEPGQPILLIDVWQCPVCRRDDNWAMIAIRAGEAPLIESIEAVTSDRATLEQAHFVSDMCAILAARLSDVPLEDLWRGRVSIVEVLREHLP